MQNITTCLWFAKNAKEAVEFYTSIFPNSSIGQITTYPIDSNPEHGGMKAGDVLTIAFTLNGNPYMALNGGAPFPHTFAASIHLECEDQAEIDKYYAKLIEDGGHEVQCSWVTDKFGLSWQVDFKNMGAMLASPNRAKAAAAMRAMITMKKLNIAAIEKAFNEA